MTISTISMLNTFLEQTVVLNQVVVEVNKLTEGIGKTTGNVEITNTGAIGGVALNVANGFIKGNVYGTFDLPGANIRVGTVSNRALGNNGIQIIAGPGIHTGNVSVNLGGQIVISAQVSLSIANTSQTAPASANTVNTVHGIALSSAAGVSSAFDQANNARTQANTGVTTAAAAFGTANSASTSAASGVSEAALARGKANTACTQSDAAGTNANTGITLGVLGRDQANVARDTANIGTIAHNRTQAIITDSGFTWSQGGTIVHSNSNTGNTLRVVGGNGINVAIDLSNYAVRINTDSSVSIDGANVTELLAGTTTKAVPVSNMVSSLAEVTVNPDAANRINVNALTGINFGVTLSAAQTHLVFINFGGLGSSRSGWIRLKQSASGNNALNTANATFLTVGGEDILLSTRPNANDIIFYNQVGPTRFLLSLARNVA